MCNTLMIFPVDWGELSILIAVMAIILLVASELISPYNRGAIMLNRQRLRRVAIVFSVVFMFTVILKAYEIIIAASSR